MSKSDTEEESETEDESGDTETKKDVFVPPPDLAGQKTIWSDDGLLRCIYATQKEMGKQFFLFSKKKQF